MSDPAIDPHTLAWIERSAGRPIVAVTPLRGATSSLLHRIEHSAGAATILRRYGASYLAAEPIAPRREFDTLMLLETTSVSAPEVVAADIDGSATGSPQLLMTALEGSPGPHDPRWAAAAAATLAAVHEVAAGTHPYRYSTYFRSEGSPEAPPWAADPGMWPAAIEVAAQPPASPPRLIHRDYHHGNLLWNGARVAAVDWPSACVGPPQVDLAHLRVNLHLGGRGDLETPFIAAYRSLTGRGPDPRWDIIDALDCLPWYDGAGAVAAWNGLPGAAAPDARRRLEGFLRAALSQL